MPKAMRMKGLVAPVHQNDDGIFSSFLCDAESGEILLTINGRAGIEVCDHIAACWNAIETHLGGTTKLVGELVGRMWILQVFMPLVVRMAKLVKADAKSMAEIRSFEHDIDALLAKLPKASSASEILPIQGSE